MDHFPVYYGSPDTLYHILEDQDSGVDELPFAAYSNFYETESPTPMSDKSLELSFFGGNHDNKSGDDDGDDEEENDLEFVDDDEDYDYRPNKSCMSKRTKNKFRKSRHVRTVDMTMFTPPKRPDAEEGSLSSTRHYARKDRTPRTIMKMMEKHRESERLASKNFAPERESSYMGFPPLERAAELKLADVPFMCIHTHLQRKFYDYYEKVRHHTLNESMRYICSRVPGYDPFAKETKVIQMQRIIGYECFLENTINNLCENIGIKRKLLGINTNFITEAMKDKKPEDWFKIGPIEVAMNDDDDSLQDTSSMDSTNIKYVRKPAGPRHYTKYRREKISSPTVDSTTGSDNIIQLFPSKKSQVALQPSESSLDGSWLSQGFRPIQESQESGIRTETQSTVGDTVFHDTIESLFDQELCSEPEHLKTVTATFMNDDIVPSSTVDDAVTEFNLSSPIKYNHNKVFLHSPKPSTMWHHPVNLYYGDSSEILGSTEMTSISPEHILPTRPKGRGMELSNSLRVDNTSFPVDTDNTSDQQTVPGTPLIYQQEDDSKESVKYENVYSHTLENPITGSKNKRKRYTPMRAPFKNISNAEHEGEEEEPEKCSQKVVKVFKHNVGGMVKTAGKAPIIVISTKKEDSCHIPNSQEDRSHTPRSLDDCHTPKSQEDKSHTPRSQKDKQHTLGPLEDKCNTLGPYEDKCYTLGSQDKCHTLGSRDKCHTLGSQDKCHTLVPREDKCHTFGSRDKCLASASHQYLPESTLEGGPETIDHRKTTWMNGFMMFCRLNRSRFLSAHPGQHCSYIQRQMGQAWRTMSTEEQQPYKEKARKYSKYMKEVKGQEAQDCSNDRLVPTSTTEDLEIIIAGL